MVAQLPPAPPVVRDVTWLETWQTGDATCDGAAVTAVRAPAPASSIGRGLPDRPGEPVRFSFTLDADGRVLDLKRDGGGWVPFGDDLGPALAAARYAGGARRGCSIAFTRRAEPIDEAPAAALFAYAALATSAPAADLRARLDALSGDCGRPYPVLSLRAYPDFKALPKTPGAPGWTLTRFDLDRSGRPVNVAVAGGSGNAALDNAGVEALKRSRFQPGARHGCLWPLRLNGDTLPAPVAPAEDMYRPAGATCPRTLPFDRPPTLTFPQAWQRRSIEGWAVVAYDVAPWGQIGNARVLAAEPAAEFGDWALNVVRGATKRTSGSGYTGCVDRVRFRIGEEGRVVLSPGESAPLPPVD